MRRKYQKINTHMINMNKSTVNGKSIKTCLSFTFSNSSKISKTCFSLVTGLKSNHLIRCLIKSFTLTFNSCSSGVLQLWNFDCTLLIARARISGIWCAIEIIMWTLKNIVIVYKYLYEFSECYNVIDEMWTQKIPELKFEMSYYIAHPHSYECSAAYVLYTEFT